MRPTACSGLLLCGLLALTATSQQPPPAKKPSLEEDIARAVQTHPDVRVAEAEAQLANAKLQQTKAVIAQKVAAAKRDVDRMKGGVVVAQRRIEAAKAVADAALGELDGLKQLQKNAVVSVQEIRGKESAYTRTRALVLEAEQNLELAKLALASAEAEYDALVGNGAPAKTVTGDVTLGVLMENGKVRATAFQTLPDLKPGSVADKLRTALSKSVAYQCKDEPLGDIVKALKDAAGLGVMVRTSPELSLITEGTQVRFTKLTFDRQELTLAGWLELVRDELAARYGGTYGSSFKVDWYVREYGLYLSAGGRPEGALTLGEFVRAVLAEKSEPKK